MWGRGSREGLKTIQNPKSVHLCVFKVYTEINGLVFLLYLNIVQNDLNGCWC